MRYSPLATILTVNRAPIRLLASLAVLLLVLDVHAGSRRRPAHLLLSENESAAWLSRNAHLLDSSDYPAPSSDLEPLRAIVGSAGIVALADATHGTHEFYTIKLRMIDFLVREMDFDVLALEAPFSIGNKLNAYVQGDDGDPRGVLADLNERLYYRFWDVEELVAVLDWMRAYNANRGVRPAVELAGFDTMDPEGAAEEVIRYLMRVDPATANAARTEYACITDPRSLDCRERAETLRDRLALRRDELAGPHSMREFDDALQAATVVTQAFDFPARDSGMAANVPWIRLHRGKTGRVVVWGHQEHAGKTESPWVPGGKSLGWYLSRQLGSDYVVIGTLTRKGSLRLWEQIPGSTSFVSLVRDIPPPVAGSHEERLSEGPGSMMLIPLRGRIPEWLEKKGPYFTMGQTPGHDRLTDSLPAKMDAVIYIETTTPTRPLQY